MIRIKIFIKNIYNLNHIKVFFLFPQNLINSIIDLVKLIKSDKII